MKTKTATIIFLAITALFAAIEVNAQIASLKSDIYPAEDTIFDGTGKEIYYYRFRKALGDVIPEILPASQDPGGNWGMITNDMQVSVRFRRTEFVAGEDIRTIIILRNLSPKSRRFFVNEAPGFFFGCCFDLTTETGKLVPIRAEETNRFQVDTNSLIYENPLDSTPIVRVGLVPVSLGAHAERWAVADLNHIFDISKPGHYSVRVLVPTFVSTSQDTAVTITSKRTMFQIVKKLSPAGFKEKEAWRQNLVDVERRVKGQSN